MGQCMVISAVFEPRGRAYHVESMTESQRARADANLTESQRARATVPTVFAYGTPRTCEPLRRKGKVILQALFDHTREEAGGGVSFAGSSSGASPGVRSRAASVAADSPPPSMLPHQPALSSSSPLPSSSPSLHALPLGRVSEESSPAASPPAPVRSPFVHSGAFASGGGGAAHSYSGPASPALSAASSTAHSAYSNVSTGAFPSVAAQREEALFGGDTALPRPSKIQAFAEMSATRQAALASKFQLAPALVLPIYAHFLRAARQYSPHARQYVIGESALAAILRAQLANARMVNRFFHIFARADAFGMQFDEFLMLLYSLSRDAGPEDKIWLSFKVCDFGQRGALGAPELANLLVTLLAQHGHTLADAEVAAIVKHTLATGDVNRSGALEYDEYTVRWRLAPHPNSRTRSRLSHFVHVFFLSTQAMMWQQLDFLALFTIDIAPLFPAVDVVEFLVETPTPLEARRRLSAFSHSPSLDARSFAHTPASASPFPGGGIGGGGGGGGLSQSMGGLRASPAFFARTRSPAVGGTALSAPPPDRPPSMSPQRSDVDATTLAPAPAVASPPPRFVPASASALLPPRTPQRAVASPVRSWSDERICDAAAASSSSSSSAAPLPVGSSPAQLQARSAQWARRLVADERDGAPTSVHHE